MACIPLPIERKWQAKKMARNAYKKKTARNPLPIERKRHVIMSKDRKWHAAHAYRKKTARNYV